MREILAAEYPDWPPLLWLAERVLCLPASEAHSERTISQVRRVLGGHFPPIPRGSVFSELLSTQLLICACQ
jgi:hypothetical protein